MTKHKNTNTIWQKIKQFFTNKCPKPNCTGTMKPVRGWNKESCDTCNYTQNI